MKKYQFKKGDGVICSSKTEKQELLQLAHSHGYPVYEESLHSSSFASFYFDCEKEFVGGAEFNITNEFTVKQFKEIITNSNSENMKTTFKPTNASLKTGMLVVNEKGDCGIVLIDDYDPEYIGRVVGKQYFPIYDCDVCFNNPTYITEVWSANDNRTALNLSTAGRTLLWKAGPIIKIGNDEVIFNNDSIKVGCTTVSHETIKQIYNKIVSK